MYNRKTTAICSMPVPIPPAKFEQDRLLHYTTPHRHITVELFFSLWVKVEGHDRWELAECWAESPIQRRARHRERRAA